MASAPTARIVNDHGVRVGLSTLCARHVLWIVALPWSAQKPHRRLKGRIYRYHRRPRTTFVTPSGRAETV